MNGTHQPRIAIISASSLLSNRNPKEPCDCFFCSQVNKRTERAKAASGSVTGPAKAEAKAERKVISAPGFLIAAGQHMKDRAATYDSPQGERSMETTVKAFNNLKGTNISVKDGWDFMLLLKMVRSDQGDFKADNFEDMVAYAALSGEQASMDAYRKAKQAA
ncbi:TPA: hypothetical protein NU805_000676 [Acinetobacter baumannii]|nr:hypothetical protein [Acinetobacter baumannii]HCJ6595734.1 hypothetical protein [Acinetobacter baumannii]HCJ6599622.1 hypothetical protein [Acinetobacter baumannii]HCJ6666101.1 hypothetical protein [Acinetobacter baumannii]HCJ6677786.1 hypothetical protein [Acinetobacter baumannii]